MMVILQIVDHNFASNWSQYYDGYIMVRRISAALYISESGDTRPIENSTLHELPYAKWTPVAAFTYMD